MESLFEEVVEKIGKIRDVEELREINRIAIVQLKLIRDIKANLVNWTVGQTVKMKQKHQNTRPWDTEGKITKVNSKTLGVNFGENGQYKVHKSMLDLVK